MILSIIRYYHWTPEYVEGLYLDGADLHSLEYWYNDLIRMKKENTKEK